MQRMIMKYVPGQKVEAEILMRDDYETAWCAGTVHKCVGARLYQVNVPGYGFATKREDELRTPVEASDETEA